MTWLYGDKVVENHDGLHPECRAFVYIIYFEGGMKYIGKKTVRAVRKLKPTKAMLEKRKNAVRRGLKNLPFVDYCGSSKLVGDLKPVRKIIVAQYANHTGCTWHEAELLFKHDALFDDTYLNQNILGKCFPNYKNGLL